MHLFAPIFPINSSVTFNDQHDKNYLAIFHQLLHSFQFQIRPKMKYNIYLSYFHLFLENLGFNDLWIGTTAVSSARFAWRMFFRTFQCERRSLLLGCYSMAQIFKFFVLKISLLWPSFPLWYGLGTFSFRRPNLTQSNLIHTLFQLSTLICQLDKVLSIFHKFNTFCDAWLGWLDVFFVDSGRIKMLICFFNLDNTRALCLYRFSLSFEKHTPRQDSLQSC